MGILKGQMRLLYKGSKHIFKLTKISLLKEQEARMGTGWKI